MNEPTATERDVVEKLADEFLAQYRAGKCPSIEEFVSEYPELADELRDLLKAVVILERNAPSSVPAAPKGHGHTSPGGLPQQIGDFLVVREIGRGGMGVVYEAIQQSLNRHVALKVLSLPSLLNPAHLERFRREARAAARLQHSHIVPVFGLGTHEGTYYYAMQYVPGQSLDIVIQSLRDSRSDAKRPLNENRQTPDRMSDVANGEPAGCGSSASADTCATALSDTELTTSAGRRQFYRNVARIGLQTAEALAYAHAEGVLHRDIKPSNLLLDPKGNIWVMDFGLAKAEGDDELTHAGDFVGTLRYTAPERLEGWSDRRSDIYSLGVTLCELLTLRPFFPNKSRTELLRLIAEGSPPAPRRIDPSIPLDLETIVLKAIAKEPAARYHRAEYMAEDLRLFLADRPILARRSAMIERLGRWCRRNPAVASLATMVVALLVTAVIILALSNAQIRRESAARVAALKDREAALYAKNEAMGKVWLFRGLYEMDGDQDATLKNFNNALAIAPNKADILWLRGFMLGSWGRWDEALADMTKARLLLGDSKLITPAARDWFVASVYCAKGDQAAYEAACSEALSRIRSERDPDERGILLWMCTVTPTAVDEPAQLAECVKAVVPSSGDELTLDQSLAAGAALYRAGKFPQARDYLWQTLRLVAARKPTVDPMSEVFAHLFLAMAEAKMGLTKEAEASLAEAKRRAKNIEPPCWVSKMQHKLLTEEAKVALASSGELLVGDATSSN